MKLQFNNIHFKRTRKRKIHDQYNCIENIFDVEIGLVQWDEYKKKYSYLSTFPYRYTEEIFNEINEFLKQLNNKLCH